MGKRKLTLREKAEKRKRNREFMTIFVNGKQKRVRRPPTIEGISVDEFIRQNADPIWLLQNEMYELLEEELNEIKQNESPGPRDGPSAKDGGECHF
jgi:hypothetical protein